MHGIVVKPDVAIISVYMSNVPHKVVECQRLCVERLIPVGARFYQLLYSSEGGKVPSHALAVDECVANSTADTVIILDIDCIPISPQAFPAFIAAANSSKLIGAVQRANHIENNQHLYVGPFCMAFNKHVYKDVGAPSFKETMRGDVGEELTYVWTAAGKQVDFLWPSAVEKPLWQLDARRTFGLGTTYENLFYHCFCIRDRRLQSVFVDRCRSQLAQ